MVIDIILWFSTRDDFVLQGIFGNVWRCFIVMTGKQGWVLLASCPAVVLNTHTYTHIYILYIYIKQKESERERRLTLLPRVECNGVMSAHCSLYLCSSNPPTSACGVAGTTGVHHHCPLIFAFFVETGFHHVT